MRNHSHIQTYFTNTFFRICIPALLLFVFSCETRNPEQLQYDLIKTNLKYKSYKTLSENTIPALIMLYNSTSNADDPDVSEGELRLLLAYSWIANGKPDFAIAESYIIRDISGEDLNQKNLASAVEATALYLKGLKTLAAKASRNSSSLMIKSPKSNEKLLKNMAFHLIMASLCVSGENYQGARYHFAGFAITSDIIWPYLIADALADIKDGKTQQGLKKIIALSKNKEFPEAMRKSLSETLSNTNKSSAPEIVRQIWTSTISTALYDDLKNASVFGIGKAEELLGILNKKLNIK